MKVKSILNGIVKATEKHSPTILVAFGIAGAAAAVVSGIKATPKAAHLIERETKRQRKLHNLEPGEKLPVKDVIKTAWKCYTPCALSFVGSMACILAANSVNARRQAAFASAYTITDTAFKEYQEKVKEVVDEKKEREVRDRIAAKKVERANPGGATHRIQNTGTGETLCFDALFGTEFRADINHIKTVVAELNTEMSKGMDYCSVNDFYNELGLEPIGIGDDVGWNVAKEGLIDIDYSSQLSQNGEPCLVINYSVAPRYDYSSYY